MRSLIFAHPNWAMAIGAVSTVYLLWAAFICILVASLKEIDPASWHARFHETLFERLRNKKDFESCAYARDLIFLPLVFAAAAIFFAAVFVCSLLGLYIFRPIFFGRLTRGNPFKVIDFYFTHQTVPYESDKEFLNPPPIIWLICIFGLITWVHAGYSLTTPASKTIPRNVQWVFFAGPPMVFGLIWLFKKFPIWSKGSQEVEHGLEILTEAWKTANNKFCRKIPVRQKPA